MLSVCVADEVVNAAQLPRNHVVDSVAAGSAHTDHADFGCKLDEVALRVDEGVLPGLGGGSRL